MSDSKDKVFKLIKVNPIAGAVGAEIENVNLSSNLDNEFRCSLISFVELQYLEIYWNDLQLNLQSLMQFFLQSIYKLMIFHFLDY